MFNLVEDDNTIVYVSEEDNPPQCTDIFDENEDEKCKLYKKC